MFPLLPGILPNVDRYFNTFLFLVYLKLISENFPFKVAKLKNLSIFRKKKVFVKIPIETKFDGLAKLIPETDLNKTKSQMHALLIEKRYLKNYKNNLYYKE